MKTKAEFENCHVLAEITHKNGEFFLEAQNYDLLPQANPIITTKKSKKPEENNESCLWSIIKNLKDNLPIVSFFDNFRFFLIDFNFSIRNTDLIKEIVLKWEGLR